MKKTISFLFLFLFTLSSFACRFTVREIGFADFGKDQYHFVLFKDSRVTDKEVKTFRSTARAAMLDANVIVQVIDVESDTSSLVKYYNEYVGEEKPNIMLISPEKRAKAFFIDKSANFSLALWDMIEDVLVSPARKELTDHIIKSYCVVYFVEGTDAKENEKAWAVLNTGIEEIKQIMGGLPHPVNTPPYVITVKAGDTKREDVLLWSLGWEKKDAAHPAVAMMYGRARRMGPMLKDDRIRQDIIENMLRFIGEDCECGLDRSWMLGTMLPLRWDNKLRKEVLTVHGFDADNPMVISEMSQILSVAPNRLNQSVNTDLLYGYSENVVMVKKAEEKRKEETPAEKAQPDKKVVKAVPEVKKEKKKEPEPKVVEKDKKTEIVEEEPTVQTVPFGKVKDVKIEETTEQDDEGFSIKDALMYSIGGLLLIVVAGLLLFFKARR